MRLALSIAALLVSASAATAACPVGDPPQMDAVLKAIKDAKTCPASMQILERCLFGSTADIQTSAAVVEKCAPDVAERYKPALDRETKTCGIKYATKDGTMYRALSAFCVAKAAAKFNRLSGTPPPKKETGEETGLPRSSARRR